MRSSNQPESKYKVVLYTDGSCAPTNPGPGGWAYLPVINGEPDELVRGSEAHSTNNRMELTAALEALKSREDGDTVELFTDSQYVKNGITGWIDTWRRKNWTRGRGKPVLNKDLWVELHAQNSRLRVEWNWVKAHAGNTFNEMVDEAARAAAIAAGDPGEEATSAAHDGRTLTSDIPLTEGYFIAAVNNGERRAAWAIVREFDGSTDIENGVEEGTSVNRALLTGVVVLMRSLDPNAPTRVTTDSEYLFKGITQWLDGWRNRGWRKSDSKPVANKDLWIEIEALRNRAPIEWQLDRRSDNHHSQSLVQIATDAARDALELSRQ